MGERRVIASLSTQGLARDFINLPRPGVLKHSSESGNVRKQIRQAICLRSQDDYGQRSVVDTLLFGKTLVHGNEYVEALGHRIKERPVVVIRPTHFRRRVNLVVRQFIG